MGFFADLFHQKKKTKSAIVIDCNAESIAGAYTYSPEGAAPILLHTHRVPVETHEGEPRERAVLRALETLGEELLRTGAPELLRASGSGRADAILVSFDTPWQKVGMRFERFERREPFFFTEGMVTAALRETKPVSPDKTLVDERIISTALNGYETRRPYGKMARHAAVAVLSSEIDRALEEETKKTLRRLFHTGTVSSIAGSALRYQSLRGAFPHEHDILVVDALGPIAYLTLVQKNLPIAFSEAARADGVASALITLAKNHPLPPTVFLLADESAVPSLRQSLVASPVASLWLSHQPRVVPLLAAHFAGLVRQTAVTSPDLPLLLMALCRQEH